MSALHSLRRSTLLIILVGPKGSGKSHIGRVLERGLDVDFFHVEPLWMAYHAECSSEGREPVIAEGIERVRPAIEEALAQHDRVCIETTGASREILDDLLRTGEPHGIFLAKIYAPLETCLRRIESRDPRHQIPMDAEMIRKVHELGSAIKLPFDLTIENVDRSDDDILDLFRSAFAHRFSSEQ